MIYGCKRKETTICAGISSIRIIAKIADKVRLIRLMHRKEVLVMAYALSLLILLIKLNGPK